MKIMQSGVAMNASRSYSKTEVVSSSTTITAGGKAASDGNSGASLSLSASAIERMQKLRLLKAEGDTNPQNSQAVTGNGGIQPSDKDSVTLQTLRKMLEALRAMREALRDQKGGKGSSRLLFPDFPTKIDLRSPLTQGTATSASLPTSGNGVWTRQTVTSSFFSETENTAFSSQGLVKTADGREINFNITLEMSRSFVEESQLITSENYYVFTDPLVINLDTNVASVTDQKFMFDLDVDGELDSISFTGAGSGFLALDKNGDGTINDGSELFGTESGNGFADLEQYDADSNGWIDENDDIFSRLKVWTKTADGTDQLIDLKQAGVGALYLGRVSTQFSLNEAETNTTNGMIRSTGVYLKESGEAGTLQHVDLAV